MRVLVLAPHPYYVDRGTPIDLDILLRVLCARPDTVVDLVAYADGADRNYSGLTIHRIPKIPLTRDSKPGFSLKKILCDILMFFMAWSLVRRRRYQVIHAGEEAAFLAMFFSRFYGVPYVYDLDSSIAQQLVEKLPALSFLSGFIEAAEGAAIRAALATAPVCNALADLCQERGAHKIVTLYDISQLKNPGAARSGRLQEEVGTTRLILLYVGNLEVYQGVDLLVEGFAIAARQSDAIDLVIIGGDPDDIERYRRRIEELGIGDRAQLLGPRPLAALDAYLADADVLVAPRIRGINTPMKVFPYLHSGRAVLLTDLPTHTQIFDPSLAMLAKPEPAAFGDAILRLAEDEDLREKLGREGRVFIEANHTFEAHCRRVNALYDWVTEQVARV